MKYVKMLALAAVAAAALMAFVGASTASATVLCKEPGTGSPTGTTCPATKAYPAGTTIHAVSEETPVLTTTFKTVDCESSTLHGKTTNEGGATETVDGPVEKLTWTNCNCDVTTLKTGTLEVHWIEKTHNGTLTSSGAEVTVSCETLFGTVHCIYVTNGTDLGTLTGGTTATTDTTAIIERTPTSSLCSEEATWHVKYEITEPKPLYVAGHT